MPRLRGQDLGAARAGASTDPGGAQAGSEVWQLRGGGWHGLQDFADLRRTVKNATLIRPALLSSSRACDAACAAKAHPREPAAAGTDAQPPSVCIATWPRPAAARSPRHSGYRRPRRRPAAAPQTRTTLDTSLPKPLLPRTCPCPKKAMWDGTRRSARWDRGCSLSTHS